MTTTKTPGNARRTTLIKLIHVAKRELGRTAGLDELAYRDVLRAVGKSESLTTMDVPAMERVLEHFKGKGFKVRPKAADRSQTVGPQVSKVRALWLFLHVLGEVRDPSERALAAYVKRIAKVDDLRWGRPAALDALIETLKKWAMRSLPAHLKTMCDEVLALHQEQPLEERSLSQLSRAYSCLNQQLGFDKHWNAWADLTTILGRSVSAAVQPLRTAESDE
ncbi:regulatory protein GemA (plasmid) [Acidovorax sp. DW039]|uniref:gp16 family protein n=1 Tax=Acidovorax sp. DW039 TaxID=3095606 RepID=UPI003090CBA4|nr:regulatory protein GemA [Acidovorax sp. DW039]BEU98632.1 regulatory protein GemA [Acidovorax sp. DW039]